MMQSYRVESNLGVRHWSADDADHAREQHVDAFPDESIVSVSVEK